MDLSSFNPAQREAVTLPVNSETMSDALIVAGAGSGKTRVLIYRIAYLRSQGVPPRAILALTFTKKAANEMQGRLAGLLTDGAPVKMSTFHALAADLLRGFGYGPFDIIDTTDQKRLWKTLIKELDLQDSVKIKDFDSWLSYQRNKCLNPETGSSLDKPVIKSYRELARAYKKAKLSIGSGVYDFDDLLEELVVLLSKNENVRKQLHARWRYILVDEYQDTNRIQFKILKLLRGPDAQVLQVGDEDQLIYSWRGAEIDHIMRSYKESMESERVHCVMLNTNYRCSGNILRLANEVVSVNSMRTNKTLDAHKDDGTPVIIAEYDSCTSESRELASKISHWQAEGVNLEDVAILMRTNRMARPLERALIEEGIPYHMHNGIAMFDSREIKLVLNLLRFTESPEEIFFFSAILDTIKMGIGPVALASLEKKRKEAGVDWITFLSTQPKYSDKQRIKELLMFYPLAKAHLDSGDLESAAKSWLHNWDLMQFYKEEERERKTETLLTFFGVLSDYEHQADLRGVSPTVLDFQEQRLLNDALSDDEKEGAVHLMTIHKSKGLEFSHGAIIGVQDGVFPMNPDLIDGDDEEDVRLAYVAITRFMNELVITRAGFRVGFNNLSSYSTLLDHHLTGLKKDGVVKYER